MGEPTTIGEELEKLTPRERAQRLVDADCPLHPGERFGDCRPCSSEHLERVRAEERAEVLEAVVTACAERFPLRYRRAETDRADVLEWVRRFHADPSSAPSLLLLGPTGTGKTYQAYGALRAAVTVALETRAGGFRAPRWQALTYADLCASLRPRGRDHDTEAVLERYRTIELLFVDDLGAAKATEFVEESTYRLINGRYEDMKPSIFTSNLALPELREAIGDRIASRLAETCVRVVLAGPDRRRTAA